MSILSEVDPKLDAAIEELKAALFPLVEHIEKSVPTTKDRYDRYMTAIPHVAEMTGIDKKGQKLAYTAIALAMERAGGNKAGIRTALRLLGAL